MRKLFTRHIILINSFLTRLSQNTSISFPFTGLHGNFMCIIIIGDTLYFQRWTRVAERLSVVLFSPTTKYGSAEAQSLPAFILNHIFRSKFIYCLSFRAIFRFASKNNSNGTPAQHEKCNFDFTEALACLMADLEQIQVPRLLLPALPLFFLFSFGRVY